MRIAAMIFGILGGLLGAIGAAFSIGDIPPEFVIWGFLSSFMAISGGVVALTRPMKGGILILSGCIGGVACAIAFVIFEGLPHYPAAPGGALVISYIASVYPLIIGGALALAASVKKSLAKGAAMILGILGGLLCAYGTYRAMIFPGVTGGVLAVGLLLPAMAIAGGVLALTRPAAAGILMVLSGISGFFLGFVPFGFWVVIYVAAIPLLIPAGILALAAREKHPPARIAAMVFGILAGFSGAFGVASARAIGGEIVIWGFLCSLMAIAGGVLVVSRPTLARRLMLLCGIGSFGAALVVIIFEPFRHIHVSFIASYFVAGLFIVAGSAFTLPAWEEHPPVRITALVMGVLGGFICALGIFWVTIWPIEMPMEVLAAAYLLPIIGVAGGVLALSRPSLAGRLMLLCAVGSLVAAFRVIIFEIFWDDLFLVSYFAAGLLMIAGALLALTSSKKKKEMTRPLL